MKRATRLVLFATLGSFACSNETGSFPSHAYIPEDLGNVHLGMTKAELMRARPAARDYSFEFGERLSTGIDVTYLFPEHLPGSGLRNQRGLLAVQIEYHLAERDQERRDSLVRRTEALWGPFREFRAPPSYRELKKYDSSPPIRTVAHIWRAPDITLTMYEALEVARSSADSTRLLEVTVQDASLPGSILLPRVYRSESPAPKNQPSSQGSQDVP